jgi:hypothetical protein
MITADNPINDLRRLILSLEDTRPEAKRTRLAGAYPTITFLVVWVLRGMASDDEGKRQWAVRELREAVGMLYQQLLGDGRSEQAMAAEALLARLVVADYPELLAWNDVAVCPLPPDIGTTQEG